MRPEDVLQLLNDGKIEKLKEELKQEILLQGVTSKGLKASQKALWKYVQKEAGARVVLKKCKTCDGYQYISDGYFAIRFNENSKNALFEEATEKENYPIEAFKNFFENYKSHNLKIDIDYKDLMNRIKLAKASKENLVEVVSENGSIWFDCKKIEIVLDSLRINDNFTAIASQSHTQAKGIYIEKNGNDAIILPVRKN